MRYLINGYYSDFGGKYPGFCPSETNWLFIKKTVEYPPALLAG
jgi:hypothetical protein